MALERKKKKSAGMRACMRACMCTEDGGAGRKRGGDSVCEKEKENTQLTKLSNVWLIYIYLHSLFKLLLIFTVVI